MIDEDKDVLICDKCKKEIGVKHDNNIQIWLMIIWIWLMIIWFTMIIKW